MNYQISTAKFHWGDVKHLDVFDRALSGYRVFLYPPASKVICHVSCYSPDGGWVGKKKDQIPPEFLEILDGCLEAGLAEPLVDWCEERAPAPYHLLFSDMVKFIKALRSLAVKEKA